MWHVFVFKTFNTIYTISGAETACRTKTKLFPEMLVDKDQRTKEVAREAGGGWNWDDLSCSRVLVVHCRADVPNLPQSCYYFSSDPIQTKSAAYFANGTI